MNNPGIKNLGDFTIVAAGIQTGAAVVDLEGMVAASINARFLYGSGGTTCVAVVQTTLDQGGTWIDISRFDFATANRHAVSNNVKTTPKGITVVAVLAAEGVFDGVLGDRLRVVVTSTGVYGGSTTLSLRAAVS